jgi:hypothetical protein
VRKDPPHHIPSLPRVAYAKNDVFAPVRFGTRAQDDGLHVACFDRHLLACFSDVVLSSKIQIAEVVRNHAMAIARVVLTSCPCIARVVAIGASAICA